jgi:phosphoglycolate phosphatase-like HAD superfamily hydrolase
MSRVRSARTVFWDFDGVIKQSIEAKAAAFVALFASSEESIRGKIRNHHLAHGGMSRYQKIPIYLDWAGVQASPQLVDEYCGRFASLVLQAVIDSAWVPGVESFLRRNPYDQIFVLMTATPQAEIREILQALALSDCFSKVVGSPTSKSEAIRSTLSERALRPEDCLAIGDARADLDAARTNAVPFLLVKHATNEGVFADYTGEWVRDFNQI